MSFGELASRSASRDNLDKVVITVETDADFSRHIHNVTRSIHKISNNVGQMRHLCDMLGGPQDSHNLRAKLYKEMIKQTNTDARTFGQPGDLSGPQKLQLEKIMRDFQRLLEQFQQFQQRSIDKCKEFVVRAKAITDIPVEMADEKAPFIGKTEERAALSLGPSLETEIAYNQALIVEREQGIKEIETAMYEVNEIFRDLGTLVVDQQGVLDNIEANMESAAYRTRGAVRELSAANEYRKRSRAKSCCFVLLLVFLGLFVFSVIISL